MPETAVTSLENAPRDLQGLCALSGAIINRLALNLELFGGPDSVQTDEYHQRHMTFLTLKNGDQAKVLLSRLEELDKGKPITIYGEGEVDQAIEQAGGKPNASTAQNNLPAVPAAPKKAPPPSLGKPSLGAGQLGGNNGTSSTSTKSENAKTPPATTGMKKRGKAQTAKKEQSTPKGASTLPASLPVGPTGPLTPSVPTQGSSAPLPDPGLTARMEVLEGKVSRLLQLMEETQMALYGGLSRAMGQPSHTWLVDLVSVLLAQDGPNKLSQDARDPKYLEAAKTRIRQEVKKQKGGAKGR